MSRSGVRDRHRPRDMRLVPGAVSVWLLTLLALHIGSVAALLCTSALVTALCVVLARLRGFRWTNGTLVVLLLAASATGGVGLREWQVERHPLATAAETGEKAELRVRLDEAPEQLRGPAYGGRAAGERSLVRASLLGFRLRGDVWRSGGDVLLLVPSATWGNLIAGQESTMSGKLLPPRDGELLTAVVSVRGPPRQIEAAPMWQRTTESLRDGLRRVSREMLGPEAAGLLPGIVVGDTGVLDQRVEGEFRSTGLTHLVAVSGANLAIVSGAVLMLCRVVRLGPGVSATGAGLALLGFVLLAGPEPSVLRAAVMGAIALVALVLGRQRSALPALAAAVIVLVLISPELAGEPAFALSVLATAGLVLIAPVWAEQLRCRGVPAGLAEAIAVPAAAEVVTAPIIAAIAGHVSLVSVLANLLVDPVVAAATVLGVLATVIGPLCEAGARGLVWMAGPELEWMIAVAHYGSSVPGGVASWPSGPYGGALLAALVLLVVLAGRSRRVRWLGAALVVGAAAVLVPVRWFTPGWPAPDWAVVSCDVGQGDGLVLATAQSDRAVVVDTGPDPSAMSSCLRRLGVRRVPLVVLTHLHADHVGGLAAVFDETAVGAVATGSSREPAWAMDAVRREARDARVPILHLAAGQRMVVPGLSLDVLGPAGAAARANSPSEANDSSVVLRANTAAGRVLLTGDAELLAQSALLASGADLRARVLKVPHHGSRKTSPRFLAAVRPSVALISVGAGNDYGHPSPTLTGMLRSLGARVERTDQRGDVAVLARSGRIAVAARDGSAKPGG